MHLITKKLQQRPWEGGSSHVSDIPSKAINPGISGHTWDITRTNLYVLKDSLLSLKPFIGSFYQDKNSQLFFPFSRVLVCGGFVGLFCFVLETSDGWITGLVAKRSEFLYCLYQFVWLTACHFTFCLSFLRVYEDNNSPSGFERLNSLIS